MSFTLAQVEHLQANSAVVESRRLFEIAIMGQTFRLAESEYGITADGQFWEPALQLISASPIVRGEALRAIPVEYVVAGLPENPTQDAEDAFASMALSIMQDWDAWFGGTIAQYLQLLIDQSAVGPMIALHKGTIIDIVPVETVGTAFFKVSTESISSRRDRTPLGNYTDRDQQRRYPGDLGCEFVPTFQLKTLNGWPF